MSVTSRSANVDLEAQTQTSIAGAQLPLPTPIAIRTYIPRSQPTEFTTDPIDDFFGYNFSRTRTHESRHDRRISDIPPPYAEVLPAYAPNAEPATLAMYLFRFGFLFPPFWIMGALILISPLRAPSTSPSSSWLPEKSESERQDIIEKMRRVEVKWAWRCLWALIAVVCIGVVIGITVWATSRT